MFVSVSATTRFPSSLPTFRYFYPFPLSAYVLVILCIRTASLLFLASHRLGESKRMGRRLRQCGPQCVSGCGCCRLLREAHEAQLEAQRVVLEKRHPLDVPKMGEGARQLMTDEQFNVSNPAVRLRMRFLH
ncbi:hypothetical protein Tb11.02.0540 [Trypanosoma brucei brucei TREU927]|uniref:Uncharacterized protein n=2 Tax=Trypanozoon TaxID=39700 RepID=Q386K7_TRYB2|nr:hypothetical protein Tb11.02.0540 [Trypanosoma brucei brucei TREU927]EAN79274.1 hypothetical protein Tb11.02.0540 [Trypanosoma brucei brucei TREU927]